MSHFGAAVLKENFAKLLENLEALVRSGKISEVKAELNALNGQRIPADLRLSFASLGRRVGLNNFALRILTPNIRNRSQSAEELAEYAVLLQRTGSIDEALKILRGLDSLRHPQVLLYLSYCYFNRWEYTESLPLLREFVRAEMPEYRKDVGRVNLAAALVASSEVREALDVLSDIERRAQASGMQRLQGNAHEIRAQALLQLGEIDAAATELDRAHALLSSGQGVAELNVRKWRAVVNAFRSKDPEPLQTFRAEATASRDWEAYVTSIFVCFSLSSAKPYLSIICLVRPGSPIAKKRSVRLVRCRPRRHSSSECLAVKRWTSPPLNLRA